jgi:glycosyltransferase involved in cell wall biosynthesis
MKIVMVMHTPLYPLTSGAVRRNFHLVREATREHDVSVLVLGHGHDDAGFREACGPGAPPVRVIHSSYSGVWKILKDAGYILTGRRVGRGTGRIQAAIREVCDTHRPDVVHVSTPFLRRFSYPRGVPVVADAHNVEYHNTERLARSTPSLLHRLYHSALARRLRLEETALSRACDVILTCSEEDRRRMQEIAPETAMNVVPNCVDITAFTSDGTARDSLEILFMGILSYRPNAEGITGFLLSSYPLVRQVLPDARVTVVGAHPPPELRRLASAQVRVTGTVPDVRQYLQRASVFVVPIHAGGGTRLKILEAMAMGVPVVSTTIGCEGLDVMPGEELLVADAPEDFARAVLRLLEDPSLGRKLADRALAKVRARYRWERAGEILRAVYTSVVRTGTTANQLRAGRMVLERQEAR